MADSSLDVDVLVIGGGFTGLTALRELTELGARALLVDSFEDHLGGRAYAYDPGRVAGCTARFDHGAEYVGDLHNGIMSAIRELLPPGSLVNGAKLRLPYPDEVMVLDQTRYVFRKDQSLFGIPGCPPQLGFAAALGMIGLLAEMSLIEWSIDVVEPWRGHPDLLALDRIDIWTWLGRKKWLTPTVKDLMRISVEALLSVEPTQISPYYLLWYTACNDGFLNEINDDAGGPQQYWLLRGTSELAERWAEPVRDRIRRGVRAERIDLTGDPVVVTLGDGSVVRAKKVLVATSPRTASKIQYTPELPAARRQLLSQPMGTTLKCQVFYRSDFWHDSNGKQYDGYVGGAHYPILWVMDNSPPDAKERGGPFVLMTFTVADELAALGPNPSHEMIVTHVTGALRDLFDDARALAGSSEFIELRAFRWDESEPHVGGGPNTVMSPGVLTGEAGRLLDEPWDEKVFFASAETARNLTPLSGRRRWSALAPQHLPEYDAQGELQPWSKPPFYTKYSDMRKSLGYMDGAMVAGRWAAHRIAKSLGLEHDAGVDAPPPEPDVAPPAEAPHAPADVSAVAAAVRRELEQLSSADVAAWAATHAKGHFGLASWLRDAVIRALADRGLVDATKPESALAGVRDFVAGLFLHAFADKADHPPENHPHLDAIKDEIHAAERFIGSFFS